MLNSLVAGVSGLKAHQEMLDVVGNNLANLNTTGFKEQVVQFADVLYQTIKDASPAGASTGGTDPIQVGFGVTTASVTSSEQQGSLTQTGGELDLALQGNGFFVVNTGSQDLYTRAGSFAIDQTGYLIDPSTGYRVQRAGTVGEGGPGSPAFQVPTSKDIKIPLGTGIPGSATTTITLQGNLSASATGPQAEVLTSAAPFLTGGVNATSITKLNSLDDTTVPYGPGDSIRLQGTTTAGATVNVTVPVDANSTLGDLVSAINTNFPGSTASISGGNLVVTANATGPSKLALTISDAGAGRTTWANHALQGTTQGKDADTATGGIQVYDVRGNAHNLGLLFQKQSNGTWNLTASLPPADGTVLSGVVQGITFNDDGSFRQVSGSPTVSFQFAGLAAAQNVTFSFGPPNGFSGLTQFGGNTSAAAINQDGFAAGALTTLSIGKDGTINGMFSNGRTLALAQLGVAEFANPGGLLRQGNNYFDVSPSSGEALIGTAQTGGRGSIQQGALEDSNVDVSLEFTRLIVAERGFEVNTRTITVSDQILQDLSNIIR
jgi:flagellar hook protein FlgE